MHPHPRLIEFLQNELAVPAEAITVVMKHPEHSVAPLPMILWQYGLVSVDQLNCIFDWLSDQSQKVQQ